MPRSNNVDDMEQRKGQHIELCLDDESQGVSSLAAYRLPYNALPEIDMEDVSTETEFLGKKLSQPIIIASMTGGSEHGRDINTNLAKAAEETGVAFGVGSQRIGLELEDARDTFELVRKHAPTAPIVANMGVVQLNYGHGIDSIRAIVDMIEADALYFHLNPLQEALQPGGDTDFSGLEKKIADIVDKLDVPVIAKEVGHGISADVAQRLMDVGVTGIDVAGTGGTSYAWVEARRANNASYEDWFKDYGIPTADAVSQVAVLKPDVLIASGGLRSPVEGLTARALGADMYSAAVPFLEPAMKSADDLVETIQNWQRGLQVAMFSSGARDWAQARSIEVTK